MQIINRFKKYLGESAIILGAGIIGYNIFNFSSSPNCNTGGSFIEFGFGGDCEFEYLAYYYADNTLLLISIGIMLIVSGILIIRGRIK